MTKVGSEIKQDFLDAVQQNRISDVTKLMTEAGSFFRVSTSYQSQQTTNK